MSSRASKAKAPAKVSMQDRLAEKVMASVRNRSWLTADRSAGEPPARRGVVPAGVIQRPVELRDPSMTNQEAIQRAVELARQIHAGGMSPQGGEPAGGLKTNDPDRGNHNPGNPWGWPAYANQPDTGVGYARCGTSAYLANSPGRSFVDASGVNRWPVMPIAQDAVDLDGDGEPDDPLSDRPVIIYYHFLEENMCDIEWDGGEDNLNLIGLRTQDTDMDDDIDLDDDPDETDGLSDTWIVDPPRTSTWVLPPPDPDDFDEEIAAALTAMGLGTIQWGDARPIFPNNDGEAVWRLAQREFGDFAEFEFEDTFDSGQVLTPEERAVFLNAFAAIERVCNIMFLPRSDDESSFGAGYPFAPKGYTLDQSGLLVATGTANDGVLPDGIGDITGYPEDDYPWILITKSHPIFDPGGADGNQSFATTLGAERNNYQNPALGFPDSTFGLLSVGGVGHLTDIDLDGFPDTPDLNADGIPDQVIFSVVGRAAGDPSNALDTTGDGMVTVADSSWNLLGPNAVGILPDISGDGNPDFVIDPNLDGNLLEIEFIDAAALTNVLQIDTDGDGVGDSLYGGAAASPAPFPVLNVPCELISITEAALEVEDIGVAVHLIMHHLGFMPEHQRPDRDEYVEVDFNNIRIDAVDDFTAVPGGLDQYANWVNNFDITPPDPANSPPTLAAMQWTIDNSGAVAGGFTIAEPVADPSGLAPDEDFDPDPTDTDSPFAVACALTGNVAGVTLDGRTVMTSPVMYGPADATVRFAYWLASADAGDLDPGDGIYLQVGCDDDGDGVVPDGDFTTVLYLNDNETAWRQIEFEIGEDYECSDASRDPSFAVRFIARDINDDNDIEAAIDYVRVINPYDFQSIMHFGEYSGTVADIIPSPGFETMTVRPDYRDRFGTIIGQRFGLSLGDRTALRNLFGDAPVDDDHVGPTDPCRADVNGDGVIDTLDIVLYLEWYNAQDLQADFAAPAGVIDSLDLIQFFIDLQRSFACQPGSPPNGLDGNNFEPI